MRDCLEVCRWQAHLVNRFGGTCSVRPQLPLLPLGVDQNSLLQQRADLSSREFLRRHLRIGDTDLLVLWLGRLSFFEKAYPQGMFISLQKAAHCSKSRIHFVMAGWFPDEQNDLVRYQEAANLTVQMSQYIFGWQKSRLFAVVAVADLFLSLVDNP